MATKPGRVVTYLEGLLPNFIMTLYPRGFAKSRNKLKTSYLHYRSAYENQTWQGGDI